jgi:hypothetical protein
MRGAERRKDTTLGPCASRGDLKPGDQDRQPGPKSRDVPAHARSRQAQRLASLGIPVVLPHNSLVDRLVVARHVLNIGAAPGLLKDVQTNRCALRGHLAAPSPQRPGRRRRQLISDPVRTAGGGVTQFCEGSLGSEDVCVTG